MLGLYFIPMLDKDTSNAQISVGVTYASLMSAASLFFTGILIAQYDSFNATIRVPIMFLIISTFSFVYAATIYSNAGNEITLGKLKTVEKYMIYSKNIVELLGLYLFILATPLVIGAVTKDNFLHTTTITVALVSLTLFSQSKFSILDKELSGHDKRYLSSVIFVLALLLYYSQIFAESGSLVFYSLVAIILLLVLMAVTVKFSIKSKQYKPVLVREYSAEDAEKLSEIILKNLDGVKANRYPKTIIDNVKEHASASAVRELAINKRIFVAEYDKKIVGMASFEANKIEQIYTGPELHKKGIGRILVDRIENELASQGYKDIDALANTIDHAFYGKLGYDDVKEIVDDEGDKFILVRKKIIENTSSGK